MANLIKNKVELLGTEVLEFAQSIPALDSQEAMDTLKDVTTIYTDLDGTLLAPLGKLLTDFDGNPSWECAKAIVQLRQAGVEIVIVTGRSRLQGNELIRIFDALAFIGEMGCVKQERGASMLDVQYDTGSFEFDAEKYATPYDAIEGSGAPQALYEHFAGKLEPNHPRCLNRDVTHAVRGYVDVDEVIEFLQSNGWQLSFEDNGMLFSTSSTLPDCPEVHGYHIVPANTSKGIAVSKDMQQRGLTKQQAVAIGDGFGDIEMGEFTGSFVMMLNGLRQQRNRNGLTNLQCNKFVTSSFCCDGWVEFANAILRARGVI